MNCPEQKKGFTLIEVVVTTAIILVILSGVLFSYPKFTQMINLRRSVQSLASDIRRVQVYGISVKENPEETGQFPAYGMHFDFLNLGDRVYFLFADVNDNALYDDGELVSSNDVPAPGYVYDICSKLKTPDIPNPNCNVECHSTNPGITGLDIIFKRPTPDIYLYRIQGAVPIGPCEDVEIVVRSPRGGSKTVVIWRTGQVAVE